DTGTASLAVAFAAGDHALTAVYGGQAFSAASSSAALTETVSPANSARFAPPVSFPTGAGPGSGIVGDFNADGVPDLLTANRLDASVSVLLGNGDGTFQDARNTAIDGFFMSEFRALEVAVGDFNGDGIQDLAVATLDPDTLGGDLSIM